MAIASCSVQVISRGKGRSAVAAAAYRSGDRLENMYDGLSHDYTRKRGIVYTEILTPDGSPEWAQDRQQLWNRVETVERRKDARLAREVMVALPRELSSGHNIELARAYARTFVDQGMVADVAIHDSGDGNPHAHIMLTVRPLDGNNFAKKKNTAWDATERVIEWRKAYEEITNECLDRYGHKEHIDVRSYEEQGLDQIPTIHLGHYAHRLEQRGEKTERGNINREVQEANREIEDINRKIGIFKREIENLKSVDDRIEHYRKVSEEVQTASEVLGHRLTERGERHFVQQLGNLQEALYRLQPSPPERERPSAPDQPLSPEEPPPRDPDRTSPSRQQATPGHAEPVHPSPAGEPERKRRFPSDEPFRGSPELPGSQDVSGKPAGQTRSPPSGGSRQPDVEEPSGRPVSPHPPLAREDVASVPAKPLSPWGQEEQSFQKPDAGTPARPVPQPGSQEIPPHHSRVSPEGKGRKLSHHDLLQKLKKERDEEQAGRDRDEDHERQK